MKRLVIAFLLTSGHLYAQQSGIEVLQLRPNFYMIAGAGGNVAVQIGPDGVVVIDSGTADKAADIIAAIKKLTDSRYATSSIPVPTPITLEAMKLWPKPDRRYFLSPTPTLREERSRLR